MSHQEDVEQSVRYLTYGPPPENPVLNGGAPVPPDEEGLFNPDRDLSDLEGYQSEPYRMPGKRAGKLYIHPASIDEAAWLNLQAIREVRDLGITDPGEAEVRRRLHAQVWQVIAVCRKGPGPGAPRVFEEKHARQLRCNPGWVDAVQQICALSDRLSSGKSEAAVFREAMAGFFGRMESWLTTCSSSLTAATWERISAALAACAASVSSMTPPGTLSADSLAQLTLPLIPEPDAPEPTEGE